MTDADTPLESDFDTRMTAEEALMWRVAEDPWLDPSGSLLSILDRPLDRDILIRKLKGAIVTIPRLAERVVESANPLEAPRWETDPDFDIEQHVIEIEVPAPGDHRALLDLVTELHDTPFPTGRPQWTAHLITGLANGKAAMLSQLHHAVADGIGSMRMAESYFELERNESMPDDIDLDAVIAQRRAAEGDAGEFSATDAIVSAVSGSLGIMKSAAAELALIGADPARAQRTGSDAFETLRSVIDQLAGDPYTDSTSELWEGRSGDRYFVTARTPLDAARALARARGGTLNDLYVTALADAALAYHAEHDATPRSIGMSFVRSTREGDGMGGNAFVPIKVRAPGGETTSEERFTTLRDAMAPSDDADEPGLSAVSSLAAVVPTPLLSRLGRDQGRRIDIVTSNMRGAPVPIYVAGALVEAMYPIGPIAGAASNATLMSYDGSLDVGIMIDPAAIEDPERFGELVQQAFDAFADAD